ncbi:MAG: prephenate dehydrogenase/arogenate dehydrogenase family protein [Candidatus Caldatribacteriota bacterium]|nr:prephenate dehydrogenase/arogenate dehydrogenase family protein [Candidatus Caldatribacteriota bacterium]
MNKEGGFKKITIIGVGLIGGSLGMAIKAGCMNSRIVGVDKLKIIEKAIALSVIDQGTDNLLEGIQNADLIIISTPIGTILKLLAEIAPHLKEKCLVTDTGSTKTEIMKEANRILPSYVDFIGGHPMAGSEKFGIDAASIQLFKNKPYILIPRNKLNQKALEKMYGIVNMIGAYPLKLDAREHDRIAAAVSHLPQLIAISLVDLSGSLAEKENNENYFKASGSAFDDMTRIASSSFEIWKDIYATNNEIVIEMIGKFKKHLDKIEDKLKNNPDDLEKDFIHANKFRKLCKNDRFFAKKSIKRKDNKEGK